MRVQGIEPTGAPFCLYYSDRPRRPGRACTRAPASRSPGPLAALAYDVLGPVSVAYAYVSTFPYPDVPRAYPKLSEWMRQLN